MANVQTASALAAATALTTSDAASLRFEAWFESSLLPANFPLPPHATLSVQGSTTIFRFSTCALSLSGTTGADLKEYLFQSLRPCVPAIYTDSSKLPLKVVCADEISAIDGSNVSLDALLAISAERVYEETDPLLTFVSDFTDEGNMGYLGMMQTRFRPCHSLVSTRSSVNAATGRLPNNVTAWTDFKTEVRQYAGPADSPLHRTRYTKVAETRFRTIYSEAKLEHWLDAEQFEVFNHVSRGARVEISVRQAVLGGVIGQPDRIIHDCDRLLIPIEVKPPSVLPDGVDIVKLSVPAFAALQTIDHRFNYLIKAQQSQWVEILGNNSAARTIIQANGYACVNRRKYTIITTLDSWWFLERPDEDVGALRIAGPIQTLDANPTVAQCLDYFVSLAIRTPECPSPSELFRSQPSGSSSLRVPDVSAYNAPSGRSSGPFQRGRMTMSAGSYSNFRRDAASMRSHIPLDKAAWIIKDDGTCEEFQEKNILPRLRGYVATGHSTVSETTLQLSNSTHHIALKTIDCSKVSQDVQDQLINELDAYFFLSGLQGSIIPQLRAFGSFQGGQFALLGTELIEGRSLTPSDKSYFDHVRQAFSTLHQFGIIHGDVAERNIMVTDWPSLPIVLVDLGMAAEADDESIRREDAAVSVLLMELS
ncbi:hypothetical protein DFS34DRAFT_620694 [Phlyctochytrium arcticum]|nr:hypothetical protein DFS34DRAFT_620694 [Phlyctochytrium arcticum]